ncbi:Target of EGR1 [Mactra antiquata]
MTVFSRVPVIDVHSDNLGEVWPSMILALSNASFIGIDTELSGLGHRKKLGAKSVEDRYMNICDTARSRSILSLGLSCFQRMGVPSQDIEKDNNFGKNFSFIVQTFNILLLCEDDFVVEPLSLKFLVQHGFDFNKQYEKGVPYYRGPDKKDASPIQSVRHLFSEIISMKKPVVVHNGLVDLMFLYENLYTSLPSSSATFLTDLVDIFPGGIIDTKYITEFEHLMTASYLEYVFRKCQKENDKKSNQCKIHFPHYPASYQYVTYRNCNVKPTYDVSLNPEAYKDALCVSYSGHGWCSKQSYCPLSHDIDLIIDVDTFMDGRRSRKRKRRRQNKDTKEMNDISVADGVDNDVNNAGNVANDNNGIKEHSDNSCMVTDHSEVNTAEILKRLKSDGDYIHSNGGHRAGYDAFMTGFIYAVYQTADDTWIDKTDEWKNKLYLGGKDYPLSVSKSSFSKHSKLHLEKINRIRNHVA